LRGAYRQYLPGDRLFFRSFRWFIVVAWLVAAGLVPHFLPSLASVTQGNNANFLPASAPSEHAAKLATPFGTSNVTPVLVLAADQRPADGG